MVDWLAGNRIRGTSTERTSTSGFNPVVGVTGGWVELGRTTLGSAGDTISVASLADKRYYMVLGNPLSSGNVSQVVRFNDDSGSNYSSRRSDDGGSDTTHVSETSARIGDNNAIGKSTFTVTNISNLSSKEKLLISHGVLQNTAGSGTAPARREVVSKWANTSDAINRIDSINPESGDYDSGSEVVVLGWDSDDTHGTNFWEELASVELGGNSTQISSGTITAKKYLWVQIYCKNISGGTPAGLVRFNNDTASNYAVRTSANGASDTTNVSQPSINLQPVGLTIPRFHNIFIINNASNEKLLIEHVTDLGSAGAGTASNRGEHVGKWTNTSAQITEIDYDSGSSAVFGSGSIMKVWGSN